MKQLELKHICPYLPYGLQGAGPTHTNYLVDVLAIHSSGVIIVDSGRDAYDYDLSCFKPALIPQSAVTEERKDAIYTKAKNWFSEDDYAIEGSIEYILKYSHYSCEYWFLEILFSEHIDVFGLLDDGLAVNKLELEVKK